MGETSPTVRGVPPQSSSRSLKKTEAQQKSLHTERERERGSGRCLGLHLITRGESSRFSEPCSFDIIFT